MRNHCCAIQPQLFAPRAFLRMPVFCRPLNSVLLTGAVLLCCTLSHAQQQTSSGTRLYGVADVSMRYLKGTTANNKGSLFMTSGALSASRWGIRGREELGNGLATIFELESGYRLYDGMQAVPGRFFNRKAFVGMQGNFGEVTFGLRNNALWELLITGWDPLLIGIYPQHGWVPMTFAFNGRNVGNAIRYRKTHRNVRIGLGYNVGGQPGSTSKNAGHVASISYVGQPLGISANVLQNRNLNAHAHTTWNLTMRYDLDAVRLTAGYYNSSDKTGFVDSQLASATGAQPHNPRKDHVFFAGIAWKASQPTLLTASFYYDRARNVSGLIGDAGKGSRLGIVLLAQYSLSRTTQLYVTADHNAVRGASRVSLPNRQHQTGAGVGLRRWF